MRAEDPVKSVASHSRRCMPSLRLSHFAARTLAAAVAPRPARLAGRCPSLHVCHRKNQTIGPPWTTIIAASFSASIAELPTDSLTDISEPLWNHVLLPFAGRRPVGIEADLACLREAGLSGAGRLAAPGRSRTPDDSSLRNSTPADSKARRIAARLFPIGVRRHASKSLTVERLTLASLAKRC
jgi:hypothetical protein